MRVKNAANRAKKAAGGPSALARALNISRSAVSQWDRVPVERVAEVADITGIPKHKIRPDIFENNQESHPA